MTLKINDKVIAGAFEDGDGKTFFEAMKPYVGLPAKIKSFYSHNTALIEVYDGKLFYWPISALYPVTEGKEEVGLREMLHNRIDELNLADKMHPSSKAACIREVKRVLSWIGVAEYYSKDNSVNPPPELHDFTNRDEPATPDVDGIKLNLQEVENILGYAKHLAKIPINDDSFVEAWRKSIGYTLDDLKALASLPVGKVVEKGDNP